MTSGWVVGGWVGGWCVCGMGGWGGQAGGRGWCVGWVGGWYLCVACSKHAEQRIAQTRPQKPIVQECPSGLFLNIAPQDCPHGRPTPPPLPHLLCRAHVGPHIRALQHAVRSPGRRQGGGLCTGRAGARCTRSAQPCVLPACMPCSAAPSWLRCSRWQLEPCPRFHVPPVRAALSLWSRAEQLCWLSTTPSIPMPRSHALHLSVQPHGTCRPICSTRHALTFVSPSSLDPPCICGSPSLPPPPPPPHHHHPHPPPTPHPNHSRLSSYGEEQLRWLDGQLAEGRPTVVVVSGPLHRSAAVAGRAHWLWSPPSCSDAPSLPSASCHQRPRLQPPPPPPLRRRTSPSPRPSWERWRRGTAGATWPACCPRTATCG